MCIYVYIRCWRHLVTVLLPENSIRKVQTLFLADSSISKTEVGLFLRSDFFGKDCLQQAQKKISYVPGGGESEVTCVCVSSDFRRKAVQFCVFFCR